MPISRGGSQNGDIEAGIEIPPGFGRDIERGRPAWVAAWIDGARPFVAQTIRGYLEAMHQLYLTDPAVKTTQPAPPPPATIEIRFKYNQDFDSVYAMVPSTISLLLALFPAILMALAVVREKELGSITNLYVTPVTRIEFLLGKQLPYIAVATVNFALMFVMALFVFQVPLKGSFPTLLLGVADLCQRDDRLWHADLGLRPHADRGAVRHRHPDRSAGDACLPACMVPVSSLSGIARIMGRGFPMTYFLPISVGTFTKGLGFRRPWRANLAGLRVFIPALTLLSLLLLRKQER